MREYPYTEDDLLAMLLDRVERAGSQAELARQMGVPRQYLHQVIRGGRKPSKRVLQALGLRREYLYVPDSP